MWWRISISAVVLGLLISCGDGGGDSAQVCNADAVANVCVTTEHGAENKLGVRRFARFSVTGTRNVTITAACVSGVDTDPDMVLYRQGALVAEADTTRVNSETLSTTLTAGDYVVELFDYNHYDSNSSNTSCYHLSIAGSSSSKPVALAPSVAAAPGPGLVVQAAPSTCNTAGEVTVSGTVTYDRVQHLADHSLNYNNIDVLPVRSARVEMICNGAVYDYTNTDENGDYTLDAPNNISSFVRVKAQMYQTGTPSWNFRVEDNTNGNALYVMDAAADTFTSNTSNYDLHATSGWGGSSYTSTRVAAPFAILDSVYEAKEKILSVAANAQFPALNINWSVNNRAVSGSTSSGNITTSHYDEDEIYILGDANDDTDEYDDHVIIHEWGHYFEAQFSRADSIGGAHSDGDILDIRLAFGEGWGNAFSGMATDDPVYSDSYGTAQSDGFGFDVDENSCSNAGWYSECSVQAILFDLYDAGVEAGDTVALGFAPIYDVLVDQQRTTSALTSLFSFIVPLKTDNPGSAADIDVLVLDQNIDDITDIYGDSQSSNNPGSVNKLPVYLSF